MAAIATQLAAVRERIAVACARADRRPESVRLLAVSKTYGPDAVSEAFAAGQRCFGENRVQEAAAKIPECPGQVEWHLVGHLQSNKAALAARLFDWIHSVDSAKLLTTLERHAGDAGRRLNVLIQVNVSGERVKSGLPPAAVPEVLALANTLSNVQVCGLMTMPPLSADPEKARPFFRQLRGLRDQWAAELKFDLPELSMGMTHDLEIAVEEGATWVRVGTAIFGPRPCALRPLEET
ncbi:MAG TPA: YggS family pyridoxal phosphate-dependent enzyme [Kiritimatiellia bacterium]|jgi:pyridoxal phosphate enzyme (YggS family)|nr:YggS family pyridoxal phosphate-dependent enzyme [Lentisphaerota bacterium]HRV31206.1 YggS family pyridoxal phosphate-dependent enzyme [Kiritimatiellia bacterium]